jgi:hypothetical protein
MVDAVIQCGVSTSEFNLSAQHNGKCIFATK